MKLRNFNMRSGMEFPKTDQIQDAHGVTLLTLKSLVSFPREKKKLTTRAVLRLSPQRVTWSPENPYNLNLDALFFCDFLYGLGSHGIHPLFSPPWKGEYVWLVHFFQAFLFSKSKSFSCFLHGGLFSQNTSNNDHF